MRNLYSTFSNSNNNGSNNDLELTGAGMDLSRCDSDFLFSLPLVSQSAHNTARCNTCTTPL